MVHFCSCSNYVQISLDHNLFLLGVLVFVGAMICYAMANVTWTTIHWSYVPDCDPVNVCDVRKTWESSSITPHMLSGKLADQTAEKHMWKACVASKIPVKTKCLFKGNIRLPKSLLTVWNASFRWLCRLEVVQSYTATSIVQSYTLAIFGV